MNAVFFQTLEFTVMLPGMLLAYLPVSSYLKQTPGRLAAWMFPLLLGISAFCGCFCYTMNFPIVCVLPVLLLLLLILYHGTLQISLWKSGNIFLAVCAAFSCFYSLSRTIAVMFEKNLERLNLPGFSYFEILYNLFCILFVLLVWYPASHTAKTMVEDENLAQTWYVFWILPVLVIVLNLFLIPKYHRTFYSQQILQGYIAMILVLLFILALFYTMFLMMANILNRNKKLQQENHFLSVQQERYENLRISIEDARQARHDTRHHFLQLSAMAEDGDLEKIKDYLSLAISKVPSLDFHFCENQAVDRVIGYYYALAQKDEIPFHARIQLPAPLLLDEADLCLVLSNLLENALEASRETAKIRQQIFVEVYPHLTSILLIKVENNFDGNVKEKNHLFHSSKRKGPGIGIQSVRRMVEKNGGSSSFTHEDGCFTVKIMLRANQIIS